MVATTSRRVSDSATPSASRKWLDEVSRDAKPRPSAMIIYGVPGVGKTSLAAHIPGVVFLCEQAEQGVHNLKDRGLVPDDVAVLPPATCWADVLGMIEALRTDEHDFKCLALDALGGFERLCHEDVCRRDFNGDWTDKGFMGYMRGFEVALADWRAFINSLDKLRDERNMSILLLGHSKVSPFKNPEGPDYDRYNVDVHHKTWSLTHKWADMVLFVNFEVVFGKADEGKAKGKAKGGQNRVAYTEHHAAFDAKNRHNLPAEIELGQQGASHAWAALSTALKNGRKAGKAA